MLVGRSDIPGLYKPPNRYDIRSFPRVNEASPLYGRTNLEDLYLESTFGCFEVFISSAPSGCK